ncbi:penicillin-binding protein PBP4 [Staphylococcus haemolyticus]|uniref:penicillin-binding protein PBP4 n=1 Tax=Staphylococcus TaxID=1279 RepID=UPI000623C8AC|nr:MULTISPECIES: penicillin-binding protein PBP4 [Staphylococcus]SII57056.1 D-alanyl-D-alanine carboxypeptidase DacB [Mycobacteroides abscessus subsp. abscessus]KKI58270.1 D-alanyl-D-alanine carboxypeptidase [Staphylococcus haemolyticus]MBC3012732.1 D-alanyl-D-alanine carboxypeptidase [Staphylococcus haemolyticus]MBC3114101.1 D-alanyl-D-alanine carboxypeptidase [Staphylococcus haemolyticus]MBC3123261.1 D-alanyl-D-alanine carboxypeptidase [Staphylococcus haemolyticus]
MFGKFVKGIGIITTISLLHTSISDASESPVTIANKEKNSSISTKYQPSGVMLTTDQGQILYNYRGNNQVDPASMSKMMTLYLTYEAIENGKLKLNDKVKITNKYATMSNLPNLSSVSLKQGQTYTIEELIKQTTLASSNAAAMILGEKVSGDNNTFTNKMNQQAKSFNMTNTNFVNPAGAQNSLLDQYAPSKFKKQDFPKSTAKDMNLLMQALIKKYPQILQISKLPRDTQRGNTFKSTNLSLKGQPLYLPGTDGLKTGTSNKGYNIALTNKQDQLRLNETIMNVKPFGDVNAKYNRNRIGNQIIKQYRQKYEYKKVLTEGDHEIDGNKYHVKKDLYDVVPKDKSKWHLAINSKGKVYVHYYRDFLPGSHYPRVAADKKWKWF